MSHFTVAVVTKEMSLDTLAKVLQPFHEFECTGEDDQYVVDVDKTEEIRQHLNEMVWVQATDLDPATRVTKKSKRSKNDGPEEEYDTGEIDYRMKWRDDDDRDFTGWVEIRRWRMDRINGKDPFTEALEYHGLEEEHIVSSLDKVDRSNAHKHSYVIWDRANTRKLDLSDDSDEEFSLPVGFQYIDRTNPNKQWDWWSLGGRWNGMLRVKPDGEAMQGRPGIFGSLDEAGGQDFARIGDIDFDAMKLAAQQERRKDLTAALVRIKERHPDKTDADIFADFKTLKDSDALIPDELVKEWRKADSGLGLYEWAKERSDLQAIRDAERTAYTRMLDFGCGFQAGRDPEEWALDVKAFGTFAFLDLEGNWNEKGSMGWWGIVTDAKDEASWEETYKAWLDHLIAEHADKYLAVVDCHI